MKKCFLEEFDPHFILNLTVIRIIRTIRKNCAYFFLIANIVELPINYYF